MILIFKLLYQYYYKRIKGFVLIAFQSSSNLPKKSLSVVFCFINCKVKMVTPVEGQVVDQVDQVSSYNCEVTNKYAMVDEEVDMDPLEYVAMVEARKAKEKEEKRKLKEKEVKDKKNKLMNPPKKEQKKGNDYKRGDEAKENQEERKPREYKIRGPPRYNRRYNNEGDEERRPRNFNGDRPRRNFQDRRPRDGEQAEGQVVDGQEKGQYRPRRQYNNDRRFNGEKKQWDGERRPRQFDGERRPFNGDRKPYYNNRNQENDEEQEQGAPRRYNYRRNNGGYQKRYQNNRGNQENAGEVDWDAAAEPKAEEPEKVTEENAENAAPADANVEKESSEVKEEPQAEEKKEEEPEVFTLDEYKKQQGEKKKHQFEVRKPNEGHEDATWKTMKKLEKAKLEDSADEEEEEVVQDVQGNKKDISKKFQFRFQNPVRRGGFKKNFDRDQEGGNPRDGGRQRYPPRNRDNRGFGGRGRNNFNGGQRRNNQPKKEKVMLDNEAEFPALG